MGGYTISPNSVMHYAHPVFHTKKIKRRKKHANGMHLKDSGGRLSPTKGQVVKLPPAQKRPKKKKPSATGQAAQAKCMSMGSAEGQSYKKAHGTVPAHLFLNSKPSSHSIDMSQALGVGGAPAMYVDTRPHQPQCMMAKSADALDQVKVENLSHRAWLDNVPSNNPNDLQSAASLPTWSFLSESPFFQQSSNGSISTADLESITFVQFQLQFHQRSSIPFPNLIPLIFYQFQFNSSAVNSNSNSASLYYILTVLVTQVYQKYIIYRMELSACYNKSTAIYSREY